MAGTFIMGAAMERRQETRINNPGTAIVWIDDVPVSVCPVRDLSISGCSLESSAALAMGASIEIKLLCVGQTDCALFGRVIRHEPSPGICECVAVEFSHLPTRSVNTISELLSN